MLIVAYGARTLNGMPVFDDWAFIDHVMRAESGEQTAVQSIFTRHNGHPSVPSRMAFFLARGVAGLDLTLLRWAAVLANVGCAIVAAVMLARAARAEEGVRFWKTDPLHPAVLAGVPISAALFLSNGHWETYSYAMCFSNIVVNLALLGALLALDAALGAPTPESRWGRFAAAIGLAVLATFSMLQGMAVWAAMAAVILVRPDRKRFMVFAAAFIGLFLIAGIWNYLAVASTLDGLSDLTRLIAAPFVILGTPLFGFIRNNAVHELDGIAGLMAAGVLLWGIWRFKGMDADLRQRAAPFVGLIVFGGLSIVMVAWGRQMFPLPVIAAPRYMEAALPAIIGGLGLICLDARANRVTQHVLTGFATLVAIGWLVTNQQEWAVSGSRARTTEKMIAQAHDKTIDRTPEWMAQNYFLDPYYAGLAIRILPWLEEKKLSLFAPDPWRQLRSEPPPEPPAGE